jgi:hypothetical protein
MKLSLAFVALTAAADSQAPVISLNLNAPPTRVAADHANSLGVETPTSYANRYTKDHALTNKASGATTPNAGAQNSFADECEVAAYGDAATHCQEPVASAYDHHDGDISESINTVYTLFVKAPQRESPTKVEDVETLDLKKRGEWVITYDVQDDAGNSAEQVQFALIMIDTQAPTWVNSPQTSNSANINADNGCTALSTCTGTKYLTRTGANQVKVELCGKTTGGYSIIQDGDQLEAHDNYDETLTQSTAKVSLQIDDVEKVSTGYKLDENTDGFSAYAWTQTANYNQPKTFKYDLYAADFADIFGHENNNNFITETGTITLDDTIAPTIDNVDGSSTYASSWECGYSAHNYRETTKQAQYSDCYDGIQTDARNKATIVQISCAGNGITTPTPIDQITSHHQELTGTYMNPSAAQIQCLAMNGHGYGTGGSTATASGTRDSSGINEVSDENSTITLTYLLKDSFENDAVNTGITRTITVTDSIAPTLYITRSQIRTANADASNTYTTGVAAGGTQKCLHHDAATDATTGDYTTEYCVQTHDSTGTHGHNANGAATYNHMSGDHAAGDHSFMADTGNIDNQNAYSSELTIQHSAGYAQDYQYVQELMEEGNGFGCYDQCSSTTTVVSWKEAGCATDSNSEFNMLQPGTYYLKYECKDKSNNVASACRTFINVDKTRPVITVLQAANQGDSAWHVEASRDNNYVDAGATCSDMVDGNISQDVEVSGDVVNMAAVGTYRINYNCEDSAGQTAVPATRTVIVEDKTCPTCTIPGGPANQIVTVEASFPYTEEQSTCTDTLDGAMPNAHVVGTVDVELTGSYVLTYTVTDKNGNGGDRPCHAAPHTNTDAPTENAAHFMKTVVVEDTMIPIISLKYRGTDLVGMMAESSTTTVNGWVIGAIASAVSGVALLGYAATRKATVATSVPV